MLAKAEMTKKDWMIQNVINVPPTAIVSLVIRVKIATDRYCSFFYYFYRPLNLIMRADLWKREKNGRTMTVM